VPTAIATGIATDSRRSSATTAIHAVTMSMILRPSLTAVIAAKYRA
jgi:hypothetical protein